MINIFSGRKVEEDEKEEEEGGVGIKREFYENGALLDDNPQRYSFFPSFAITWGFLRNLLLVGLNPFLWLKKKDPLLLWLLLFWYETKKDKEKYCLLFKNKK